MPTTTKSHLFSPSSSIHFPSLTRSILSFRKTQINFMDSHLDHQDQEDLELFQKHTFDRFLQLSSSASLESSSIPTDNGIGNGSDNFLSIGWIRNLLDVFLCCEAEFKAVLILGRDPSHISKPPLDRLIPELFDRASKALDICNAITNSIDSILNWQKSALIVVSGLHKQSLVSEGQLKRSKKALISLLASMMTDDKDGSSSKTTERARSFGRKSTLLSSSVVVVNKDHQNWGNFRSFSWGVSKNWSASKQIQAMSINLVVPRGGDSNGLALPVYIMSTVMVFVMWTLVTAIPCQDRTGLGNHFQMPRQFSWTKPIVGLQDRITDEWKKKEKKGSVRLLDEIVKLEKCSQAIIELTDSIQFPVEEEQAKMVEEQVSELAEICTKMEEGLIPLQQQVREVFHRIVKSRSVFLELLESNGKSSSSSF